VQLAVIDRALFNHIVGETRLCADGSREFPAIRGVQPAVSARIG